MTEGLFQSSPGQTGRWHYLAVALILIVALLLRVGYLSKSFGRDEIETLIAAQQPVTGLMEQLRTSDSHPPLVYIMLNGWLTIGSGPAWIRLFFVIFGLGLCWLAYILGRVVGGPVMGLLTLAIVAVAPGLVWASQYVRPYGPAYSFLTLATICGIKLSEGARGARWWGGYFLAALASLYSFYMSVLVLASLSLALLTGRGIWPNRRKTWLSIHVGIAVAFLPGVWFFFQQAGRIGTNEWVVARRGLWLGAVHLGGVVRSAAGVTGLDPFVLFRYSISQTIPRTVLLPLAVLGLCGLCGLGWVIFRRNRLASSQRLFFGIVVLLPLLLAVIVHSGWQVALSSRYFLAQTVPAAVLIAGWMMTWQRRTLGVVATILLVAGLTRAWIVTSRAHEEWQGAVAFVEARQRVGDVMVFPRTGVEPYRYYANRPLPTVELDALFPPAERRRTPKDMDQVLCQMVLPFRRVWIVDDQYYADVPWVQAVEGWLSDRAYRMKEGRRFPGATMSLFSRDQENGSLLTHKGSETGRRPCP